MNYYLKKHINNGSYLSEEKTVFPLKIYKNSDGWKDIYIGPHLIFSHRTTYYNKKNFPEKLHNHNFYEIIIFCSGDISYISDEQEIHPKRDDIIIFPPGNTHTTKLLENGIYERCVLYFSKDFFFNMGKEYIPEVLSSNCVCNVAVDIHNKCNFLYIVEKLKELTYSETTLSPFLAYSYAMQIFHIIFYETTVNNNRVSFIPENIIEIKRYIDKNYKSISSTTDVSDYFFYSREHLSRLFKQYYNMNISEYIQSKKLFFAKELLVSGHSVGFACDTSGFNSMSSFSLAFHKKYGISPSKYLKNYKC